MGVWNYHIFCLGADRCSICGWRRYQDPELGKAEKVTDRETYRIAQRFHEEYERLAPMYAWTTQEASVVPWEQLPDNQRRLMCRVVEKLRAEGTIGGATDESER